MAISKPTFEAGQGDLSSPFSQILTILSFAYFAYGNRCS